MTWPLLLSAAVLSADFARPHRACGPSWATPRLLHGRGRGPCSPGAVAAGAAGSTGPLLLRPPSLRGPPPARHGPEGPLDELAGYIVPQPGPQWATGAPLPEPAIPEVEALDEAELGWRRLLLALIPESESLVALARGAEEDMRQPLVTGPKAADLRDGQETDSHEARAVRRAVWTNLGSAVRAVLMSLEGEDEAAARERAAKGAFPRAIDEDHCGDVEGLAAAIDGAWAVAACDVEDLWAAQRLLSECRGLRPAGTATPMGA